ncbi:MAG: recombinase family protein [Chloroflexota bacterium]|nr:recombinase family protein [Chloroflexota bacterium]
MTTTPRAAIYCRVSTSSQGEDGTSLSTQEQLCRQYAAARGYAVDEELVVREAWSGTQLHDRPKLTRLREAIQARLVATLIAYSTDRLARDPIHLAIIAEACERAGVSLEFVTEPLDSSPEGALIRYVKGYAAKIEHEKIKERTLRGKRAHAAAGQLSPTVADLYGYQYDPATRGRRVNETQAAIVRQIFRWYVDERTSIRSIATRLNATGVPSPSTDKRKPKAGRTAPSWSCAIVQRILSDTTYKGEAYVWRHTTDAHGRHILRPESEWIRLPESVSPAIVSSELWQAARDRRSENKGADTRNRSRPYLLRGTIYCATCGRRMYADPHRSKGGGPVSRTYRCPSRELPGGACGGRRVPAAAVEAWAWEQMKAAINDPSLITEQREQARREGPDPALLADLDTARRELAKLAQQQERLANRLREADDALWGLIERELRNIEAEKGQYRTMIADIEARLAQQQATIDQFDELEAYCQRVAGNLERFGFAEKRLAFEAFNVRIEANGTQDAGTWRLRGSAPVSVGAAAGIGGDLFSRSRGAGHHPWSGSGWR